MVIVTRCHEPVKTWGRAKFRQQVAVAGFEAPQPPVRRDAVRRAREAVQKSGRSAVVNIWVDPREYAPGTKAQTMYK